MAAGAIRKTINDNELDLRNSMWPDAEDRLWNRVAYGGFISIPKTMPLLGRMMDEMSKNFPVSATYYALWARTWDKNAFVRLNKLEEIAFEAGFTGQRGVRTLQDRLKRLEALGFIELKAAGINKMAFIFLPNPHAMIFQHYEALTSPTAPPAAKALAAGLQGGTFNAFLARAQELGCKDVKALIDARAAKISIRAPVEPAAAARPARSRLSRRLVPGAKLAHEPLG